jgi:cytochrome b561
VIAKYSRTARLLHWAMAVPFIGLLLFGEHMMGNHQGRFLPTLHASAGFILLLLVALRLWWRWTNPPPSPLESQPAWERGWRMERCILRWRLSL